MPYRHAHWYVLALFPLAALAFWPGYLAVFRTAGTEFHAHGITASLWVALLAFQSWAIHHGQREAHRAAGIASLSLFPLFMAGGVAIFIGMASRYANEVSPFHILYAPRLAWLDIVSVAGIAIFYFLALRHRRRVQAHSRYMLATVFFLISPILSRLSPFVPALEVHGPAEMYKIGYGVQIANATALGIALALAFRPAKHGRPFLLAACLIALSMLLFETIGRSPLWHALFASFANVPVLPAMIATAAVAAVIGWMGWQAGDRFPRPLSPEPA